VSDPSVTHESRNVPRERSGGDRDSVLTAGGTETKTEVMSQEEIDAYLGALEEPKQSTLRELRRTILGIIPEAEQCISYGMPAFRIRGKVIAGFAAFKNHLSYLPHSGSVLAELQDEVAAYTTSKGALQFLVGSPLPKALVEKLIAVRISQAFQDSPSE